MRLVFETREQTGQRTGAIAQVADQLGINRANDILKAASALFAAELDRPPTR